MSVQDDKRENRMLDLFNLQQPPNRVRHGTDAILQIESHTLEFELKSVTTRGRGLTTVRDFGPAHIAKWKNKHWLVSVWHDDTLLYCKYGSPAAMASWVEEKWNYIKSDFALAQHVPDLITLEIMYAIVGAKEVYTLADARRLHKAQYSKSKYVEQMDVISEVRGREKPIGYSPERMLEILKDRARYVIERGSTLNNPHIPPSYYSSWEEITQDHAIRLRELVKEWINANEPKANVPLQAPPDTP
jgi:hypothetical protein